MSFQRPAFWRVPHNRSDPDFRRKKVEFVNPATPAQRELIRGDIITKIDEYDARDLRHEDAQNLFRNAGNTIKLAIQRDATQGKIPPSMSNGSSRCSSSMLHSPLPAPYIPVATTPYSGSPVPSGPSPLFRSALAAPVASLPHTVFPPELPRFGTLPHQRSNSTPITPSFGSKSPGFYTPTCFREESAEEAESILNQVADTILHRVGGEEAAVKYAHKQFNSPIGLYSEANIVDTIKRDTNTVPYKKTVLYDPAKSETYKALQEDALGDTIQEVPVPVQQKIFHAPTTRTGPIKKSAAQPPAQKQPPSRNATYVSTLNDEVIQQSNSFKRLMYNVLGETDY